MLKVAMRKNGLAGRLVKGSIESLPFADQSADLAICSLSLGYAARPERAIQEMRRVARRVIVSDLHPQALSAGWVRSFRAHGRQYEIEHRNYALPRSSWCVEASFGDPERKIFEQAGKAGHFEELSRIPAIFVAGWVAGWEMT
jgi:ubiquinone/menaquinone biosynthesis C-methylase UbiE